MVRSRRTTAPGGQGPGAAGAASARQSTLRTANLALVARQVLSSPEPVSRADVAAATGMTRSTASRLADDLVAAGILAELDPAPATGPGPHVSPTIGAAAPVPAMSATDRAGATATAARMGRRAAAATRPPGAYSRTAATSRGGRRSLQPAMGILSSWQS